ncbi:His-Xaa-Ser system radical SAM maturase HxsB [Victivallis sp. Marseille-Q1083]|uniref:His-Xaa-Ser system radical SAM maturase HxsB n=1 Tax=Victivallis sp. Marseille-Q1083 TaxID=2717288 RepID=UPI001C37AABE|nr:His-Xaa-Ser system radical SAM maturase HxsB [Victivallis sp. Marseille-Q1083]
MMNERYFLLPFRFRHLAGRELLVNEVGDFLVVPAGTVARIVGRQIRPTEELYKDLIAAFFISESLIPEWLDLYAVRLRTRKAFLNEFTSLHIFVLTLRCNQNCIYCQASSQKQDAVGYDMPEVVLLYSIDLMFQSPAAALTMEFQGGEPSLVPELFRLAVETAERRKVECGKQITYVLCTNCVELSAEVLEICRQYHVLISTSLDGPENLHNHNRGREDSYSRVTTGIARAREWLGEDRVSALMTAAPASLTKPHEIIDTYLELGFHSVFLRSLNPYGVAMQNLDWTEYGERFIAFYRKALDYIISLNRNGTVLVEELTLLFLRRILTPFSDGFVDLRSPSGLMSGVAVYHCDGYVYASDESRMLAACGDFQFRIGPVSESYEKLFHGIQVQDLADVNTVEGIAGCSDCAFQAYCGADPVRNYAVQQDRYGYRPASEVCKKCTAIIEHLFSLIIEREEEVMPVFRRWLAEWNG